MRVPVVGRAGRSTSILTLAVLLLAGCTGAPDPAPSASASASEEPSPLLPVYPAEPTADAITLETATVAEALARAIGEANIVNDDLNDQTTPATETTGASYAVVQTLTLDPVLDAADQARSLVLTLGEAGWRSADTTDAPSTYLAALVSGEDAATSWFLLVGADLSVPGQSVVTLQLASPDLP